MSSGEGERPLQVPPEAHAVHVEQVDDGIALIRVDDGKVNALSLDLIASLDRSVASSGEEARAIVIAGRPGVLSGGLDRSVIDRGVEAEVDGLIQAASRMYRTIAMTRVPVVVACTGHAVAAGALLLLVADMRVGADLPSRIGLLEVAIGVPLPQLGLDLARLRLDRTAFVRSTVHAELYSPAGAVTAGYLDELADESMLLDVAIQRAQALSQLDGRAFAATKARVFMPMFG